MSVDAVTTTGLRTALRSVARYRGAAALILTVLLITHYHSGREGGGQSPNEEAAPGSSGEASSQEEEGEARAPTSLKTILYYSLFDGGRDFQFGFGHSPFVRHGCPVSGCLLTANRSLLPSVADFDAVLFHPVRMARERGGRGRLEVPRERRASQRYVMVLAEPPPRLRDSLYRRLRGFFNWTMTYRSDSDLPHPYGWIEPRGRPRVRPRYRSDPPVDWAPYDEADFARSLPGRGQAFLSLPLRPRTVGWIASHCHTRSGRESYVRELARHVDVGVMGGCGAVRCQNTKGLDNCTAALEKDFKFYLSFENALCDEYVSEKFFQRMAQTVVPIVMGRGHYAEIAPPHSYIDVADFPSPEALAQHLSRLDGDPAAYLSYFWWKDRYRSVWSKERKSVAFCELCRKLHDPSEPERVVGDLSRWWTGGAGDGCSGSSSSSSSQKWRRTPWPKYGDA